MTYEDIREALVTHLVDLDETYVLTLVERLLQEGVDPLAVIKDCEKAMFGVGELYATRQYYLSGLLMAGEIFREVMALTQPHMEQQLTGKAFGLVLLGTVQGDIHDIGKNLVSTMLAVNGFKVMDLGVDVPSETFIHKAEEGSANIIAVSSLLSTTIANMQELIHLMRDLGCRDRYKVLVGGGQVTPEFAKEIGADGYGEEAMQASAIAKQLLAK